VKVVEVGAGGEGMVTEAEHLLLAVGRELKSSRSAVGRERKSNPWEVERELKLDPS
jgi:hypothetical protein